MNWFVHGQKQTITEEWDHCEHLKVGDVAPYMVGEQDSFGPVARMGMCKDCHEKHKAEQDAELVYCQDCGEQKPSKEVNEWRWYDFDQNQGDEARRVCDTCWSLDKHKARMERDAREYANEFGDDY